MITKVLGTRALHERPAAKDLYLILKTAEGVSGALIFSWPLGPTLKGSKDAYVCDAVLISPEGQTTIIDIADDGRDTGQQARRIRQDHAFNIVSGCPNQDPDLMDGRTPRVVPKTVTFAPESEETLPEDPETPSANRREILAKLAEFQSGPPEGITGEQVETAIIRDHHRTAPRLKEGQVKIFAASMWVNSVTIGKDHVEVAGTREEFIKSILAANGNARVCKGKDPADVQSDGCLDHEEYRFNAEENGEWIPLPEGWDGFLIGYTGGG